MSAFFAQPSVFSITSCECISWYEITTDLHAVSWYLLLPWWQSPVHLELAYHENSELLCADDLMLIAVTQHEMVLKLIWLEGWFGKEVCYGQC